MIDLDNELEAGLFWFAEWLDSDCGLMKSVEETGDFRTHEDLAEAFLRYTGKRQASTTQQRLDAATSQRDKLNDDNLRLAEDNHSLQERVEWLHQVASELLGHSPRPVPGGPWGAFA